MEILIIEPVDLTDDELASALVIAAMIRHSGALMESEVVFIDNVIGRIDSLIAARKFVRKLHQLTASIDAA
jgi:hypothetical protein